MFAQPRPTPDPTKFRVPHPSDSAAYRTIDELNREHKLAPLPFPPPRDLPEPRLTLEQVLGAEGPQVVAEIEQAGALVFHAVGDTGNVRGPDSQNQVADKLAADFAEDGAAELPRFFFHLGDVIYNFGEARYYYDQFYDPYRDYPAPILALAGNHDGMVAPGSGARTLTAYLENFCAEQFEVTPEAGGLSRTAQIQPGVFFTFEAPMLRIIALYSNTLEDPGVIADEHIGDSQLTFLRSALTRAKDFTGALILAHHHPAYTAGAKHGWSVAMTQQIDKICHETGVWPHAVLSAHAHNYQRFTRKRGDAEVPYLIAGNGGHGLQRLSREAAPQQQASHGHGGPTRAGGNRFGTPLRTPLVIQDAGIGIDQVVLENYDDQDYGYLRLVVTAQQLRIEYHPASDGDGAKTPDDFVTVDLRSRQLVHFRPRLTALDASRKAGP
ncbi:MAG: metallophosphoesterase [Acidisphaera sp.]|nr:metallophosphoesterase [Acidisphaera sp.]